MFYWMTNKIFEIFFHVSSLFELIDEWLCARRGSYILRDTSMSRLFYISFI